MTTAVSPQAATAQAVVLPKNRGAYYAGAWHEPKAGRFVESINPGTGQSLGKVADSGADDIDAAVASAKVAFAEWRRALPLERAKILRRLCHGNEGRIDSDGPRRDQFLSARALGRRRPHHSLQPPLHVLRGKIRGPARRR